MDNFQYTSLLNAWGNYIRGSLRHLSFPQCSVGLATPSNSSGSLYTDSQLDEVEHKIGIMRQRSPIHAEILKIIHIQQVDHIGKLAKKIGLVSGTKVTPQQARIIRGTAEGYFEGLMNSK